ncbi:MAG: hypothetical protein IKJ30_03695 [Bacilli bacterium]|nr:hypothetical protein [Bacilli bacterium]
MGYLIPKSARNVKLQLFKGLGLPEAGILAATVVLALLVFNTGWGIGVQIVVIALMALFALMLVSPSFITNKKGYQSFGVIFDFFSQEKYYKKRSGVVKNGKK